MKTIKFPNCGQQIDADGEEIIGKFYKVVIGIFVWLTIPAFMYGCYIHYSEWLIKYTQTEFIIYSILTILLMLACGWVGYRFIFGKEKDNGEV